MTETTEKKRLQDKKVDTGKIFAVALFGFLILIMVSIVLGMVENYKVKTYFGKNKTAIMTDINETIEKNKIALASEKITKYLFVNDDDLNKLNSKIIAINSKKDEVETKKLNREALINSSFNQWDGSHYELTRILKNALKDPDSYQHIKTVYWDQKTYLKVRTTYRAKNSFGGYTDGAVTATFALDGKLIKIISQS